MDSMFPSWILPFWITGSPLLALIADYLLSSKTTQMISDSKKPLYAASPVMA